MAVKSTRKNGRIGQVNWDVETWFSQIDDGLEFRKQFGKEAHWGTLERLYNNTDSPDAVVDVDRDDTNLEGPNIIFSTGDRFLSEVRVSDPYIAVRPTKPESLAQAPVVERVDNQLVDQIGLKEQVELATLHGYLFGAGFVKIGFDSEFGWEPELSVSDNLASTLTQFAKNRRIEFNSDIRPGMPWVKAVLPHDIVVPWGTISLEDTPWIAHRTIRHIDDILADPKYKNKSKLMPTMSSKDFVNSYNTIRAESRVSQKSTFTGNTVAMGESEPEFVELWEIHDKRTNEIVVIATGHTHILRKVDNATAFGGLPFVSIGFTKSTRAIWRTSLAEYLRSAQSELLDIAKQSTIHRRLSNVKALIKEGAMDDTEIARMTSSDPLAVAKVSASVENIRDAITFFQPPSDSGLSVENERVRRDAAETVGFNPNMQGQFQGKTHISAAETNNVAMNANKRESKHGQSISLMYTDLFKKINPLVARYWKAPRIIEITGEEGAQNFVSITGQDLKGSFDYNVRLTSWAEREQLILRNLNIMTQMSQMPGINLQGLNSLMMAEINDPRWNQIFSNVQSAVVNQSTPGRGQLPR